MKRLLTILIFALIALAGCNDINHPFSPTYEVGAILSQPSKFEGVFHCRGLVVSSTDIFGFGRSFNIEDSQHYSIRVKTYREILPQVGETLTIKCKLDEVFSFGDNKMLMLTELRE